MGRKTGKKSSSSAKRSISSVKRSNQRKNKLIKKGKLKPKSSSTYHNTHQKKKAKDDKAKRDREQEKRRWEDDEQEESASDEDERMGLDEALALAGRGGGGGKALDQIEADYLTSGKPKEAGKKAKAKALLPLKTKSGLVFQEGEEEEGGDDDDEDEDNDSDEDDEGLGSEDEDAAVQEPKTVLQLISEREELLSNLKVQVGSMAANFLEVPEERLYLLDKLVALLSNSPAVIKNASFKLVSATLTEIFKDVLPAYAITTHGQDDGALMKKETLRLQGFEQGILKQCKTFLMALEARLKMRGHALKCLGALLVSHPHFNYAANVVQLLTPLLDHRDAAVRAQVQRTFEAVFAGDKKGEISLCVVKHIKKMVVKKNYGVHENALECLSSLRLHYLKDLKAEKEREQEEEKERKRKKAKNFQPLSKKDRKRKKQLEKVEREMLEAKGEEGKKVREKFFTECMTIAFAMLFRVIKDSDSFKSKLLAPVLKSVSKFVHLINIDFFHDLLKELCAHVQRPKLRTRDKLLCVQTAFDILTGPGECITFDPSKLIAEFHKIVLATDLGQPPESVAVICKIATDIVVKRKRQVSRELVQGMAKALGIMALQVSPEGAAEVREALSRIRAAHLRTYEAIMSAEEEEATPANRGATMYNEAVADAGVTLWEQTLLGKEPVERKGWDQERGTGRKKQQQQQNGHAPRNHKRQKMQ